jgi:hypothetical protein
MADDAKDEMMNGRKPDGKRGWDRWVDGWNPLAIWEESLLGMLFPLDY